MHIIHHALSLLVVVKCVTVSNINYQVGGTSCCFCRFHVRLVDKIFRWPFFKIIQCFKTKMSTTTPFKVAPSVCACRLL